MSVTVKYFASLAEQLGRREDTLTPDASMTARSIWCRATGADALPANVLVAINQEYVDASQAVNDGDEVAFFPPVTGG